MAPPGEWGPWVNGGAWLRVDGVAVDWILRDLDRVERVWAECQEGRHEVGVQAGHPLGFWSPCYVGELALGRVLADPGGELAALKKETAHYPPALRRSLVNAAWEAEFLVTVAAKSAPRGDALHVSLCLSHAFGVLCQALYASAERWLLNEKGSLDIAATLPGAPDGFAGRVREILTDLGPRAVERAGVLVAEVRGALG